MPSLRLVLPPLCHSPGASVRKAPRLRKFRPPRGNAGVPGPACVAMRGPRVAPTLEIPHKDSRCMPCAATFHLRCGVASLTDGACLLPAIPQVWLAAWAVCSAVSQGDIPVIVAGGPVAGLLQTAFSAELSAVLAAILVCISKALPCWIYCDCQGVVDRVQGFMLGFPRPNNRGRNSDLWQRIFDAVLQAGPLLKAIVKVRAHQDSDRASDRREAWLRLNNHLVDRAADALNKARPQHFLELWERVRKGWVLESLRAKFVVDLHKSVAMAAVCNEAPEQPVREVPGAVGGPALSCPVVSNEELRSVSVTYGYQFVQVLANWVRLQCHAGAGQQARWISLLQVLVLFYRGTGLKPPLFHKRSRRWVLPGIHPEADFIEVDMAQRLQWWNRCFKTVTLAHGGSCFLQETRPYSTVLLLRMQSVVVKWKPDAFQEADAILLARMGQSCAGHSRMWARTMFL